MVRQIAKAVKSVYASTFFNGSRNYIQASGNLLGEEKMAVVIQDICGSCHGDYFYPLMSGVGRSCNSYPIGNEKPEGTKYYLRYYNGTVSEVSYTVNGKPATKEQIETIKQFTPVSSSSRSTPTDAGLSEEKQVRVQCVSFENIKELTIDGTTYELA